MESFLRTIKTLKFLAETIFYGLKCSTDYPFALSISNGYAYVSRFFHGNEDTITVTTHIGESAKNERELAAVAWFKSLLLIDGNTFNEGKNIVLYLPLKTWYLMGNLTIDEEENRTPLEKEMLDRITDLMFGFRQRGLGLILFPKIPFSRYSKEA